MVMMVVGWGKKRNGVRTNEERKAEKGVANYAKRGSARMREKRR